MGTNLVRVATQGNAHAASVPGVGVVKCVSARQSPFEDAQFANCSTVLAIFRRQSVHAVFA